MSAPWLDILARPVAFHPVFVKLTGSVNAALMLSQALYWSKKTKDTDGWFYKTETQWEAEIYLSRREQQVARKRLKGCGFWIEKRKGNPAHLYFRIDLHDLEYKLVHLNNKKPPSRKAPVQQDAPTGATEIAGSVQQVAPTGATPRARPSDLTETTTEITTEITNTEAALRAARVNDIRRMLGFLNRRIGPIPKPQPEAAAVKWMLDAGYPAEQCIACMESLSKETWRTAAVTWVTVKSQIGAWIRKNGVTESDSTENQGRRLRKGRNE